MQPSEIGNRMCHEFIGIVEAVGADVRTIRPGDLVVAPFDAALAPGKVAGPRYNPSTMAMIDR